MTEAAKATAPATPAAAYAEHRLAQTVIIAFGVALIAGLADFFDKSTGIIIFAPPLAASLFLIIALPESAMSQPRAVIGGQLLCAIISIGVDKYFPIPELQVATALFLSIAAMISLRMVHAPAAAMVYFITASHLDWHVILSPILPGLALIIVCGFGYNRLRKHVYPRRWL